MDTLITTPRRRADAAPYPSGALIELRGVDKAYRTGRVTYPALDGIDLEVAQGEMVAIVGPSGSGKSTLLNLFTGVDRPTRGTVTVAGARIDQLSENALARWRSEHVGIVFQFFQLLPTLTALQNAALPLDLAHRGRRRRRLDVARRNLSRVGLAGKEEHLPSELSGGEQQRVAIARAIACEPTLLVADEPTGNLDTATASAIFDLLAELHGGGMTIVFVTHDDELAHRASRRVTIRDGRVAAGSAP
jgi:putative ABC transport system ATP-binding protein